ncbi:waprin-Thr1 [Zootermopsis nevadensis]|nr:waprin-Thr1 [Zootermopsis nevadensis]
MERKEFVFITALLTILIITSNASAQSRKSGHCPPSRRVTNCFNRCKTDYVCSFDEKCCPNVCGSESCAKSSSISYGSDNRDESESVYCDNVKCQSGEKCVLDKRTKRNKCGRG